MERGGGEEDDFDNDDDDGSDEDDDADSDENDDDGSGYSDNDGDDDSVKYVKQKYDQANILLRSPGLASLPYKPDSLKWWSNHQPNSLPGGKTQATE